MATTTNDILTKHNMVVDLLNEAILASTDKEKVVNLCKVQEYVINNDLVDNFLDEILAFQNEPMVEVRKFMVNFIEAACSKDAEFFPKLIVNLHFALNDSSPHVVKKGIQVSTLLYPKFLKWASKANVTEILEQTNEVWGNIKRFIFNLLDSSENDGVRTQCIKFMEMVVISQTKLDQWSDAKELSLDSLENCKLVNLEQLEEEASYVFEQLLIYHGTPHISSVNLMTTMQSLVIIARQRSDRFISKVIQALESLHANLPPTLASSQVTSVRKQLKVQLTLLLKHPAAATSHQFQSQIIQLLNDLGAGQSEVYKCLQEVRKRGLKVDQVNIEPKPKKIKLEPDVDHTTQITTSVTTNNNRDKLESSTVTPLPPPPKVTRNDANTAIDITSEDLIPCLNSIENVCDLVLVSLLSLPDSMPAHFQATYTPVAAAGTPSQIKHLARLLSTQFTSAGIGKGVEEMVEKAAEKAKKVQNSTEQQFKKIATLVSRGIAQEAKKQEQALQINNQNKINKLMPTGKTLGGSVKVKQLNFEEITSELSDDLKVRMIADSISRIIQAEDRKQITCPTHIESRNKVLTLLSTEFHDHSFNVATLVRTYAFEDIRNRADLLFDLVYNEYVAAKKNGGNLSHYEKCLSSVIQDLIERVDVRDRDHFLPRFFFEVPLLIPEVITQLEEMITRETSYNGITLGFSILQTLIEKKVKLRSLTLSVLLNLSILVDKPEVRSQSVKVIKYLHETYGADVKEPIEKFSLEKLRRLLDPSPTGEPESSWTEEVIKIFLLPYLSLLPNNHKLMHDLALVYVSTIPDIKRVILRVLDTPVKGMGMDSPELLLLVETCPKGAETLVTRIIHVLTDKQPPSAELVSRVRDLYHKRVPDVRFLIPVLNGLTKREVIAALPKLIKLNQLVVKEVFNRLLGTQVESGQNYQSPLTAADLLVALHNIDPSKCDMKTVMKAIGLCFAEKHIYTAEVLAVVMQLLMEQNPLPTLLMRTVIQSLSLHPRLLGFVMNILQRLILKQVWNQKKVWEGFIKCCQRTKPQSFQVLLQLPAPQLRTVFRNAPDFKPTLQEHVESFTDTQRSHLPQSILDVIFSPDDLVVKEEPSSLATLSTDPTISELEVDGQPNSPVDPSSTKQQLQTINSLANNCTIVNNSQTLINSTIRTNNINLTQITTITATPPTISNDGTPSMMET